VSLLVDTGVLLLALRRDVEQSAPEVVALSHALLGADHNPEQVARALVKALESNKVVEHLQNTDMSIELALALRQSVKLREMQSAVADLREILNSGQVEESIYQGWCERHSWAFGSMYVLRDELRDIGPHDSLDLLIPGMVTGYRDIIELKRPDKQVVREDTSRRSWYFSSDVSKAIGQCHRYLDLLGDVARQGLRDHPEIIAYHPRATIGHLEKSKRQLI
jgi:hypothetical protein